MADATIADLAAVTDLVGTDEYILMRAGVSKKIDASDLATEILALASPGGSTELDYVQFTSNVTISGTSAAAATTVVTSGSVAYDGSTAVIIECYVPVVDQPTAGSLTVFVLYEGSTNLGRIGETFVAGGSGTATNVSAVSWYGLHRLTPGAGSKTYSLRAWRVTANTTAQAGSGGTGDGDILPGFIRITTA